MSLIKNISRIKKLESVQPDKRWEKTTKFDLLEEISSQNRLMKAQKLSKTQKVDLFVMRFFNHAAPSMTKALIVFLIFMMFFGVNIAAQASVPGERLWPVKRSIEEAEISLTFSVVKKTEVHIKHVNERLDEIDKILEEDIAITETETQAEQEDAIKQAVSHLEQDIASVDSSLQVVKEEKEAIEIVELVQKVTSATKEAIIELEIKIEDADNIIIEEALDDAKEAQVEVETAAVDLAIEIHDELVAAEVLVIIEEVPIVEDPESFDPELKTEGQSRGEEVPAIVLISEELEAVKIIVAEIVAEQIENLAEQIDTTQEDVDNIVAEELVELTEIAEDPTQNLDEKETAEAVEEVEDIDNVKENPEAAIVVLDEAKVLLEEGSFKEAIAKVDESKELNDKSEVILEKLNDLQEVVKDVSVEEPIEPIAEGPEQEHGTEVLSETNTSTVAIEAEEIIEATGIKIKESEEVVVEEE